jgi:hypothetical protein
MPQQKSEPLTLKNTKQQMLDAYNELVKKLEEKRESELKPEQKAEAQKVERAVKTADSLSLDGVTEGIGKIKTEMNKLFTALVDKSENELTKYDQIKEAIKAKEKELEEIFEIRKSASSLAALIEAQNQRRKEFEVEMEEKKQQLSAEMEQTRGAWETEKAQYEAELKERRASEAKKWEREKEEYEYSFKREQQLSRDKFEDEKAKTEKELTEKRQQVEKELTERESVVAEREKKVDALEKRVTDLENQRDEAIATAVQEATNDLQADFEAKETLLKKEFEGERNVLTTRIHSLEETVKKQNEQIGLLSKQLEKAGVQVQDIAVKAIEGSSHSKLFAQLQSLIEEKKSKEIEAKSDKAIR